MPIANYESDGTYRLIQVLVSDDPINVWDILRYEHGVNPLNAEDRVLMDPVVVNTSPLSDEEVSGFMSDYAALNSGCQHHWGA